MDVVDRIVSGIALIAPNNGVSQRRKLIGILAAMVVDGKHDSLKGLLERFTNNGMQNQLASWISTRPNETISAAQIEQAFATETLEVIALQAGITRTVAAQELAETIPQFIDKLTPTGVMPSDEVISGVLAKMV